LKVTGSNGNYYPSGSIQGTIYFANGTSQPFSVIKSYGPYFSGTEFGYAVPTDPSLTVSKISISARCTPALSVESTVWLNSERIIECNLPTGFISAGYKFKSLVSFASLEEDATRYIELVDSAGNTFSCENNWIIPPLSNPINKIRIRITPPATTSENLFTKPIGIVILKQLN
jgi:hypothetical protein